MTNIKIHLRGSLQRYVSVNDICIHIFGVLGTDDTREKRLVFSGPAASIFSDDDKVVFSELLSNLNVSDIVFITSITEKKSKKLQEEDSLNQHEDFEAIYDINISDIEPMLVKKNSVLRIGSTCEPINTAIIGGVNGKLDDIKASYEIIKERHVAPGINAILIPDSPASYKEAIKKGYIEEFIDAGFIVFPPEFIPEENGKIDCISTMSSFSSEGFTAGPHVVAASSLIGKTADPRMVDSKEERKAEKKNEKQMEKAVKLAEKAERAAAKAEIAASKTRK